MNERILELAKEARINCVVPTDGTLEFTDKGDIEHLKKFAELIVRECAGVCEEYRGTEWGKAAECIGDSIKEHFGVEE